MIVKAMRTTLTIDDDLLAAAKILAREKRLSIGRVLSDLARAGLTGAPRPPDRTKHRFPVFHVPKGARPITLQDVEKIENNA